METKEKIKKLREELAKNQEILDLDLENWVPAGKPGMLGKQRQARQKHPEILTDLGIAILQNSAVFFMSRNHKSAESNIKKASEAANGLAVDFLEIEKRIKNKIFQGQTKEFRLIADSVLGMNDLMFQVGKEINAESMPMVNVLGSEYGVYKNEHDLISKLEVILERNFAGELKPIYLFNKIVNEAVNNNKDSYQILVYNSPEDDTILNRDVQLFSNIANVQAKILKNKKEEQK